MEYRFCVSRSCRNRSAQLFQDNIVRRNCSRVSNVRGGAAFNAPDGKEWPVTASIPQPAIMLQARLDTATPSCRRRQQSSGMALYTPAVLGDASRAVRRAPWSLYDAATNGRASWSMNGERRDSTSACAAATHVPTSCRDKFHELPKASIPVAPL
jgi:hypothetical protein